MITSYSNMIQPHERANSTLTKWSNIDNTEGGGLKWLNICEWRQEVWPSLYFKQLPGNHFDSQICTNAICKIDVASQCSPTNKHWAKLTVRDWLLHKWNCYDCPVCPSWSSIQRRHCNSQTRGTESHSTQTTFTRHVINELKVTALNLSKWHTVSLQHGQSCGWKCQPCSQNPCGKKTYFFESLLLMLVNSKF